MDINENTPQIDTITLPTVGLSGSPEYTITVSCELMKNQRHASPITPHRNIVVAQDKDGRPMIFTIGTDNRFRLLRYQDATATGWNEIDLSAGFTGYDTARCFAIAQDRAGRISVAVA